MSEMTQKKTTKIWLISAICGVLAFLALLLIAGYSTIASLIVGILVSVLVAILLWIGWYEEDDVAADPANGHPSADATREGVMKTTGIGDGPISAKTEFDTSRANPIASATPTASQDALTEDASVTKTPTKKAPAKKTPTKKAPAKATKSDAATAPKSTAEKTTAPKPAAKSAASSAKVKRAAVAKDGNPADVVLASARDGKADDLKMLKGVGPKIEQQLHALGFFHFDQVGSLRKKEIEWLDEQLVGTSAKQIESWQPDAKTLAKGDATEFSKRAKY